MIVFITSTRLQGLPDPRIGVTGLPCGRLFHRIPIIGTKAGSIIRLFSEKNLPNLH